jgi:hypothetical protein
MLKTRVEHIHARARRIALRILSPVFQNRSNDTESNRSLDYEATCWVDALSMECLEGFCKLLNEASLLSLSSVASVGLAWTKAGLPGSVACIPFSAVLTTALSQVPGHSSGLALQTFQVATKCLLYQRNPLPLAALIVYLREKAEQSDMAKSDSGEELWKYAQSLLKMELVAEEQQQLLAMVVSGFLSRTSLLYRTVEFATGEHIFEVSPSHGEAIVASRLLIHIMKISEGCASTTTRCVALLRRNLPILLQVCMLEGAILKLMAEDMLTFIRFLLSSKPRVRTRSSRLHSC